MNQPRSASRFLIVSGTYLFVILLAVTVHSVWSSPLQVSATDVRDLFFLPVWICIPFVAIISKSIKAKQERKELVSTSTLFRILIVSVVIGFFLNASDRIFSFEGYGTVLFIVTLIGAGISILLLIPAYVFSKQKAGLVLLILEWMFWTLKALVYYKTSPDLIVNGYFTVLCWLLRLVLIRKLVVKSKAPVSVSA